MEKQSVWFSKDKIFRKYRIVPLKRSKYNPRERERESKTYEFLVEQLRVRDERTKQWLLYGSNVNSVFIIFFFFLGSLFFYPLPFTLSFLNNLATTVIIVIIMVLTQWLALFYQYFSYWFVRFHNYCIIKYSFLLLLSATFQIHYPTYRNQ